jgi:hypothetical protein
LATTDEKQTIRASVIGHAVCFHSDNRVLQLSRLLGTIEQMDDQDADQLPVGNVSQRQVDFLSQVLLVHPF